MDKEYANSLQQPPDTSVPFLPPRSITPPTTPSAAVGTMNTTVELLACMADSDNSLSGEIDSEENMGGNDSDLVAEDGSNDELGGANGGNAVFDGVHSYLPRKL